MEVIFSQPFLSGISTNKRGSDRCKREVRAEESGLRMHSRRRLTSRDCAEWRFAISAMSRNKFAYFEGRISRGIVMKLHEPRYLPVHHSRISNSRAFHSARLYV